MPVYLAYIGITLLHCIKELFLIPWFPFICQPDSSKESELSSHKSKISVIFPTCHALPYKEKPFPFPLGLAAPVMFGAASPRVLLDSSRHPWAPGFLVPPAGFSVLS